MRFALLACVSIGLLASCGSDPGGDPEAAAPFNSSSHAVAPAHRTLQTAPDPAGVVASFSSQAFDAGATNAFFTALGPNGRSCSTCHLQEAGWTINTDGTRALALAHPDDPLFAPVDGSDCPPTSASQPPNAANSSLTVNYGLIRIQIPVPGSADFSLVSATNPKVCAIPPGDPSIHGALFLFRRPLPTASLPLLSTVMWDGRETIQKITTARGLTRLGPLFADLEDQDNGATLGHEQRPQPILGTPMSADMLAFETPIYNAQLTLSSLALDRAGGHGGPEYLAHAVAPQFFVGVNDPLQPGFSSRIFDLYKPWENLGDKKRRDHDHDDDADELRAAIGRGEKIFNEKTFTITNVAGLNSAATDPLANPADPLFNTPIVGGTCGVCHNNPNVGNHSTSLPINIGVTMANPTDNAGNSIAGVLDIGNLPIYTLRSETRTVDVTDPGRALISGKFVDVGKTKGPNLRGLAARAPYFHNGSAKDLATVVEFYDRRFQIGLTEQESSDLVKFLEAL